MCGDWHRAEDAAQEALIRVYRSWHRVVVPHDFSIMDRPDGSRPDGSPPFDPATVSGQDSGYLPGGTGWYRRYLTLTPVDASRIVRLIVTQGMACVAAGWALGLAGTFAAVRSIEHLLFGVTVTDWPALAGASAALGAAGLLGCLVPAFRASLIDPVQALRAE